MSLVPDAVAKSATAKTLVAGSVAATGVIAIAVTLAVVLLSGGGSDARSVSGDELPDACSLVTAAEAKALLGEDVVAAPGEQGGCIFRPASDAGGSIGCPLISTLIWKVTDRSRPDLQVDTEPGLGDDAFWYQSNLVVLKGDVAFSVSAWLAQPPECGADADEIKSWRDEGRELAEHVLTRLGG